MMLHISSLYNAGLMMAGTLVVAQAFLKEEAMGGSAVKAEGPSPLVAGPARGVTFHVAHRRHLGRGMGRESSAGREPPTAQEGKGRSGGDIALGMANVAYSAGMRRQCAR